MRRGRGAPLGVLDLDSLEGRAVQVVILELVGHILITSRARLLQEEP